eukprot:3422202-Prymnesium_polylepis.1
MTRGEKAGRNAMGRAARRASDARSRPSLRRPPPAAGERTSRGPPQALQSARGRGCVEGGRATSSPTARRCDNAAARRAAPRAPRPRTPATPSRRARAS